MHLEKSVQLTEHTEHSDLTERHKPTVQRADLWLSCLVLLLSDSQNQPHFEDHYQKHMFIWK